MNTALTNNAIRLSPAHIPAAAKTVARRSGLIAIPVVVFAAIVLVLSVLIYVMNGADAGKFLASIYLPLVGLSVGAYGIRLLIQQRRATLAAVKANADPSTFWYLSGFVVTPYVRGAPDASLSFKVPPKLRMHLASAGRYVPPP